MKGGGTFAVLRTRYPLRLDIEGGYGEQMLGRTEM